MVSFFLYNSKWITMISFRSFFLLNLVKRKRCQIWIWHVAAWKVERTKEPTNLLPGLSFFLNHFSFKFLIKKTYFHFLFLSSSSSLRAGCCWCWCFILGDHHRFSRFPAILCHFVGFYQILPGLTRFYRVLLGFNWFYLVLLDFTEFYWVLLGFTGFYWVVPSFT